jgi:hypothetical protein
MKRTRILGGLIVTVAVALLSLATQVTAQPQPEPANEPDAASPVQVETLDLEPTVVKTGDLITQTYRVRFPDLISEGKEIIILEDRMVPENLPVHPFEAVSLDVRKRQIEDEHIWDFVFGFRLIEPEKATYVLPAFSFFYLVRDLGEDVEDAEVHQVDGGGGLVRYVTTLTDIPIIDIRDTIELGSFATRATVFRTLGWTVAPLPLLIWLIMLVRLARQQTTVSEIQQLEADELDRLEAQIPPPPSIWQARRNLLLQLKVLEALPPSDNGTALRDLERNLVIAGREYLQAELRGVHTGDTPKDIQRHIDGLEDGARKEGLRALVSRLVDYQSGLEYGSPHAIGDPMAEAQALRQSLTMLRPHMRLWMRVKGLFGAG